jgi:hypothetical protein
MEVIVLAGPVTCDEGDGAAQVLITFVESGDVTALCANHFLAYCRAFIEQADNPLPAEPESEAPKSDEPEPSPPVESESESSSAAAAADESGDNGVQRGAASAEEPRGANVEPAGIGDDAARVVDG